MTDRYIDLDEMQIYGPYAARKMRELGAGLVPEFDPIIELLASGLETHTADAKKATARARKVGGDIRLGSRSKAPLLKQAVEYLGRFSTHLDAHPKSAGIDRKTFFAEDGTASGVGRGAGRVLHALGRIATELGVETCPVREREAWLREVEALVAAFGPAVAHASDARTARATTTPGLSAARSAWLNHYSACKNGMESALRLSGSLHLMPAIFYDLVVPAGTKVVKAPE